MKYNETVKAVGQILTLYTMPLTLRQIFYRLVAARIIANTLTNYKTLSRILVRARERGDIDENRIEDRSRETIGGDWGYDDPGQFLAKELESFKKCYENYIRSFWQDQPYRVEVWLEKDALSRLVADVAREYRVTVCPARGYGSYSYIRNGAGRFAGDKPTVVLYFGDWDPSGLDITRDLRERLERYGAKNFQVCRVALTPEQIRRYKLPPMPAKRDDPRYAKFVADTGSGDAVELDALEPDVLQRLVRKSIVEYIDRRIWDATQRQIKQDREWIKWKLAGLRFTVTES
jgi:hypothetical protein